MWEQARARGILPSEEDIESRRALSGGRHLKLAGHQVHLEKPGMKLGFGAIGKGYAADRAAAFLQGQGFSNYLIDVGGDLLVKGRKGGRSWEVALRHPRRKEFLATFAAVDGAIASSGDYERYFVVEGQRYSHILDLRTGWPARQLSGVTVMAGSATDADALATALFVMETSRGIALVETLPGVEAILVDTEGMMTMSSGLRLEGGRLVVDRQQSAEGSH